MSPSSENYEYYSHNIDTLTYLLPVISKGINSHCQKPVETNATINMQTRHAYTEI